MRTNRAIGGLTIGLHSPVADFLFMCKKLRVYRLHSYCNERRAQKGAVFLARPENKANDIKTTTTTTITLMCVIHRINCTPKMAIQGHSRSYLFRSK